MPRSPDLVQRLAGLPGLAVMLAGPGLAPTARAGPATPTVRRLGTASYATGGGSDAEWHAIVAGSSSFNLQIVFTDPQGARIEAAPGRYQIRAALPGGSESVQAVQREARGNRLVAIRVDG